MITSKQKASEPHQTALLIPAAQLAPTVEQIHQRAQDIYVARGGMEGMTLNDWLQAEQQLKNENNQH